MLFTLLLPQTVFAAESAHVLAVGDVMLGRYVETLMRQHGNEYPFAHISDWLAAPSFTMVNLEGPIDSTHNQTPNGVMLFSFLPGMAQVLADQGIDYVSLANNHALDQGEAGRNDSHAYLDAAKVGYSGYPPVVDDTAVFHTTINEQSATIISLSRVFTHWTTAEAEVVIQQQRIERPDDFILIYIHWGNEYESVGNTAQQQLGRAILDAGADVVIGHHPHVVQNVELYKGKLIIYSLGNFIFDQYFSAETQEELAVHLVIDDEKIIYVFEPLISKTTQPALVTGEAKETWLESWAQDSAESLRPYLEAGRVQLLRTTSK